MLYLLWIGMFLVTYLTGRGFLTITGITTKTKKEYDQLDYLLTGVPICIGIAEAAHLTALFLRRNVSECVRWMEILYLLAAAAGVFVIFYEKRKNKKLLMKIYRDNGFNRTAYYLGFVAAVIIVIQFVSIQVNEHVYLDGDMTVETVRTFLATDRFFEVNPLTGQGYVQGVPTRWKILCLPSLYAFLTVVFRMNVIDVVWQGVPAYVLICAYAAFWKFGKSLFSHNPTRRNLFFLFAAFILVVGDYRMGMDGFLLLQSGFRGAAIRSLILIPYVIYAALGHKWIPLVLCIIAEACISWTFYGAGVCLFAAAGILITEYLLKKGKEIPL